MKCNRCLSCVYVFNSGRGGKGDSTTVDLFLSSKRMTPYIDLLRQSALSVPKDVFHATTDRLSVPATISEMEIFISVDHCKLEKVFLGHHTRTVKRAANWSLFRSRACTHDWPDKSREERRCLKCPCDSRLDPGESW